MARNLVTCDISDEDKETYLYRWREGLAHPPGWFLDNVYQLALNTPGALAYMLEEAKPE